MEPEGDLDFKKEKRIPSDPCNSCHICTGKRKWRGLGGERRGAGSGQTPVWLRKKVLVEQQREELNSARQWGWGRKQAKGPWHSHPPELSSDRWGHWGQRGKVPCKHSQGSATHVTAPCSLPEHPIYTSLCLWSRIHLKLTKTGGWCFSSNQVEETLGSPSLAPQGLNTQENWTNFILL